MKIVQFGEKLYLLDVFLAGSQCRKVVYERLRNGVLNPLGDQLDVLQARVVLHLSSFPEGNITEIQDP